MAAGLAASGALALANQASATCEDLLAPAASHAAGSRALTAEDLVRLRDIGPPEAGNALGQALYALSPDGRSIAFQLRRGDPSTNLYCLGMVVMPVDGSASPIAVDEGGDLIRTTSDVKGLAALPSGIPKVITPQWAADGRSIAFLKRADGVVQVWRAGIAGGGSAMLTHSRTDVERFLLVGDGQGVIFSTRPALPAARAAIEREGLSGFHYDDRYAPLLSNRPIPRSDDAPELAFVLDFATGTVRLATASEHAQLLGGPSDQHSATKRTRSAFGRNAWTAVDPGAPWSAGDRLFAEASDGTARRCNDPRCHGSILSLWWTGRNVRFLRLEGWSLDRMAIYEWTPGRAAPRQLYSTSDMLVVCVPSGGDVLCARERSNQPRHLVRIDLRTKRVSTLFDPNPEFSSLRLGRIERLEWKTAAGHEVFGDLVYPVDYHPGTRVPVIVVQYSSRGFLRGGTGVEYPIQAFANAGFVVLSLNRPQQSFPTKLRSAAALNRYDVDDFRLRRDFQSALDVAIHNLIDRGIADPARIGITGLSDGAATVQFAELNSRLFAAGAVSGCCWERAEGALVGPMLARVFSEAGYPELSREAPEFWSRFSLAQNGDHLRFPLLMQEADAEYLGALESFTGLRQKGAPVDLYVFPGEYHYKWQPAHILASYRRNLAWFEYWLKGSAACGQCTDRERKDWDALRTDASVSRLADLSALNKNLR